MALGCIGQGGTLSTVGMLFVKRCTWAHIVVEAGRLLNLVGEGLLRGEESAALEGKHTPEGMLISVESQGTWTW
jgi:hypothetical protein